MIRYGSHAQNLSERELKTEREEQEYHTYLTPEVYAMQVGNAGHIRHIRRGEKASHDIPQYYGLLQFLEQQCHSTSANQYQRKVGYQWF